MNEIESLKNEVSRKLRRNSLASGFFILTAASLLIPAFSVEGSRFSYTLFCFRPPHLTHPEQHDYCTGEKIRRGITWRVALESEQNQQFASKVSILKTIPAANPYAGLYGVAAAGFLGAAFGFFKLGTNQLEDSLDAFIWSRRRELYRRALDHEMDVTLDATRKHNEAEFIKEMMSREHGQALLELMSDGERQLAAERYAKGERLDQAQFDLHLATLKAQAAEQVEKEAKHKSETAKLNKPPKKKDSGAEPTGDEAAKAELIEKLKEHEGGWLYTLCTTRKILIIEGEQGSFKSYTGGLIAYIRYQLVGHKLGWICDTDYHQNKSEAWAILQPLEPDNYGANKDGESLREGIKRFYEGIKIRDEKNFAVETLIFDELTTYADYRECEGVAENFMKFALSAPRKAAYGLIAITHSNTNTGGGGGGGMAKARQRGALHLLLNADNDYHPTFKGTLNGFKNEVGELVVDMPVTLPDWFRPQAIEKMFKGGSTHANG